MGAVAGGAVVGVHRNRKGSQGDGFCTGCHPKTAAVGRSYWCGRQESALAAASGADQAGVRFERFDVPRCRVGITVVQVVPALGGGPAGAAPLVPCCASLQHVPGHTRHARSAACRGGSPPAGARSYACSCARRTDSTKPTLTHNALRPLLTDRAGLGTLPEHSPDRHASARPRCTRACAW